MMTPLADDPTVVQRIFDHIDNKTTDISDQTWREPVENYRSQVRFTVERDVVLRRYPTAFCPSAALPSPGSYIAREAAGVPLLAVRGNDGRVRTFRNACRHRGTQLVDGAGCEKAFVCRYHGWTYGLEGQLRHVPHEYGFPGLDKSERGLAPVDSVEAQGLVFVTQDRRPVTDAQLDRLPPLIPDTYRLIVSNEQEIPANWKVLVEGFLEGYHIRSTHSGTFYPVQFDNLNVVEAFGRNNRIAFPYRAIHKLRSIPPAQRCADGKLTYVYHLFPNVMVATFPGSIFMVAIEPLAVDRTRFVTYILSDREERDAVAEPSDNRGDFIAAGALEDREVACAIQRSLGSGANQFLEFGLFEGAIGRFHRALQAAIDETEKL
jgi:phenylpropionate dioxygenase-like ring-hydroxylating dioxygenase large terminal subunit